MIDTPRRVDARKRLAPESERAFDDRGAALVELALLLPFLAVMIFGTIDIARAFQMKNRLTNAAREGAWYAQMNPTKVSATGACATSSIAGLTENEDAKIFSGATVTVTDLGPNGGGTFPRAVTGCATATVAQGNLVEVRITAPMKVFTPFISIGTGNQVTISGFERTVVI